MNDLPVNPLTLVTSYRSSRATSAIGTVWRLKKTLLMNLNSIITLNIHPDLVN